MKKILKFNVLQMLLCGIVFFAKSDSVTVFASTEGVGTKEVSTEDRYADTQGTERTIILDMASFLDNLHVF